ncbi:MAG: DAK2 domain-containing protein [Erysipelotrichaceae bacterium]|nr:DAK2 domain-containing protein [Erysipelotrichaceae bacterium]
MFTVAELFAEWAKIFNENIEYLTELDSVAGDADLGLVMNDGFSKTSVFVAENAEKDVGKLLFQAGKYFNSVASSSMGTLLSAGMMNAGKKLRGKEALEPGDCYTILQGIGEGVQNIGQAKEGEKTFLDGIMPAVRALENVEDVKTGITVAYEAAVKGVEDAKNMVGKHGRIAFRGEDSVGIIDPGSVVAKFLVEGMKNLLN